MKKSEDKNTVIINATNIGYKFHGLGVYSLNLLKELSKLKTSIQFIVYVNKTAKLAIDQITFPNNFSIKWASEKISPDNKFKGHLLRLIYSNWISFKHRNALQFNTSQLEINFFRKNQIVTIHDVIPVLFRHLHKKQYHYYKMLLGFGLRKAKYVLTPSYHSKEMLQKIYKINSEQIKVIHNGADNSSKNIQIPQINKDNYIIYVGRICEMKNIRGILKAFEMIAEKFSHDLLFIGDDKKKLQQEIEGAKLSPKTSERILFKENVSEEEKTKLLSKASIFLFPSFYEGFGLPPIEAMACGCPVVVSNNSSLPEICGDAAIYINPNNFEEIAEAITKVLSDKSLMNEMIFNSIDHARLFKWRFSAEEHLNVFTEVINFERMPETNLAPKFLSIIPSEVRKMVSNI